MKNIFKVSLLAAAVAFTVGCNEKKEEVTIAVEKEEVAPVVVQKEEVAPVSFANGQEKSAYAIGASFAGYIMTTLEKQAEFGLEALDKEIILKGITDKLRGKSEITEDEMMVTLKAYDAEVKAAASKKQEQQATKIAESGKNFLTENAKMEGVTVTESGLQYSVITKADGPKPAAEDTVSVHYVGTLVDGTEFDSSVKRGQPAKFPLNRVIPGWTEGVQLMSVGEKYKFVIPPELAYGEQGAGSIPPGSTLIFEVELLEIAATEAPAAETPVAE
jgi:FKBP-type peptidyl-prolyl cis-trans isomerase FkpA